MQRREVIRLLFGTAALPLAPRDVLALLVQAHDQLPATPSLKTLKPHQDMTVAAIAEWIIPQTDTPGAKAARVNEFIDLILTEWCDEDDKEAFLTGLDNVDIQSRSLFGKNFVDCPPVQQMELLTILDEELTQMKQAEVGGSRRRRRHYGSVDRSFFHTIKQLTLVGYFTSEEGARQALHYEIIPSQHTGCAPLEEPEAAK
ncbi:MAG TPA: gluconate 2-dehydrogenase subunit 3 family protein [Terriglobales bacterium]|nr:gluconate 2-dehydrogenase subunit 3 family protein [Terriglobales bacterium]